MNIVAAMLSNWEDARASYETGLNSMGSMTKEFEKTQDSLYFKINQFKNNIVGFWQEALNTEGMKSFIDAGSALINMFTALISKVGLLPPVIATLTTAFFLFNTTAIAGFYAGIGKAITGITAFSHALTVMNTRLVLSEAIVTGLIGAFSLLKFVFPIAVITLASVGISKLTQHFMELRQEQKKVEEQNKKLIQSWSGNNKELKSLIAQAEALKKATNDGQSGSLEDRQKYFDLTNQINNLLPNLINNIDSEGNAHLKNSEEIKKEIDYLDELLKKKKEVEIANAEDTFDGLIGNSKDIEKQINNLREKLASGMQGHGNGLWSYTEGEMEQFEYKLLELEKQFADSQSAIKDEVKKIIGHILSLNNVEIGEGLQEQLSNVINSIDFEGKTEKEIVEISKKIAEIFGNINVDNINLDKLKKELASLDDSIDEQELETLVKAIEEIGKAGKDAADGVKELEFSLEDIKKTIEDSQSKYKLAEQALKEFADTGKYNISTLLELAEKHEGLLDVLGDEQAVRQELTNIISEEEEVQKRAYANMLMQSEAFYNAKILGNTTLVNELKDKYDIDFKNFKSLAEAKSKVEAELLKRLSKMWSDYYNVESKSLTYNYAEMTRLRNTMQASGMDTSKMDANINELYGMASKVAQLSKDFENIAYNAAGASFNSVNFGSGSSDKGKKENQFSKIYDLATTKAEKFKHEIELLNDALDDTEDIIKKQDISNQLIAKYQEYYNYLKEVFTYQNSQLDQVKTKLKSVLSDSDFNKLMNGDFSSLKIANEDTAELIDKFKDLQSAVRSTDIELNSIDDSIRKVKESAVEMYREIYEEAKSSYEEQEKALKDIANDIIDIYKEMYKKQKDLKLKSIDDELKAEEERSKKVIERLDKELDKYEEIINAKLKLIDATEDEESYEKQLAKLQEDRQDIVSQINTLSMDDSIEARNRVFELNEELADKEEEIEEFKHKREIELRKNNLRDQLDSYKKEVDKKKEAENNKLEAYKNELQLEKEYWEQHYEDLINDERRFAEIREDILSGHFDNISDEFEDFADFVDDNMKDIGKSISQNLIDKMEEAEKLLKSTYDNYSDSKSSYEKSKDNYEKEKEKQDKEEKEDNSPNITGKTFKGTIHTYYVDANGGIYKDDRYLSLGSSTQKALEQDPAGKQALEYAKWVKANRKHEGGFVSADSPPNKISELVNKLFNTKGDERLTLALKDEFFSPQKNIMNNFRPNMQNFVSNIVQPSTQSSGGVINIEKFIEIGRIDKGANLDINKITDQAFNRFVEKLKPYGFLPSRV